MKTPARKTVITLSTALALVALAHLSAQASHPQALLLPPTPGYALPKFGFSSFNIHGVGERVTFVQHSGLACQLGLEPGDMILRLNGFPLTYHGAWDEALYHALASGGWVQLTIRDVRTGLLAHRTTFVGSGPIVGPITPKYHVGGGLHHPPVVHHKHHVGYPSGPITQKSQVPSPHAKSSNTLKKLAKLFD